MILNAKFGGNSSQIIKLAGFMHGSLPHDAAEKKYKIKVVKYIQENRSDKN